MTRTIYRPWSAAVGLTVLFACCASAHAEVRLPNLFSDNMVLQCEWKDLAQPNLMNKEGLPALKQRTATLVPIVPLALFTGEAPPPTP